MKKMLLVGAASAAVLTSTAFAMDNAMDNQFYLKLEGGATKLNKTTDIGYGVKMKSNTSGIVGAGVGFYVMDNVRSELTFDVLLSPRFKKTFPSTNDNNQPVIANAKHKGKIGSLLLSAYVDFYDAGAFKLYAGAGIGTAQVRETIQYVATPSSGSTAQVESYSAKIKRAYNFAYQLGAGASVAVADGVNVELGYSWRDYGKTKSNVIEGTTVGKTRYRGHNVMAGVRFDI